MRARARIPAAVDAYASGSRLEGLTLRRALLGGTFDPPHIGHLSLAQAAWEQLDVDVVTFLPAGDPWQKSDDRAVTGASARCEMVAAAIAGVKHFELDRREADRPGPTFTWDTVLSFAEDELTLLVGADAAAGIPSWHRAADLVAAVELAVVGRPGTPRSEVEAVLGAAHLRWLEMPALDISSTELRRWISLGFSARFIIPDQVRAVIARHGLYAAEV